MLPILNRLETDCDWALLHQETLYRLDARGRILPEPDEPRAPFPRFHFIRTRHGNLWRLHRSLDSSSCRALARLAGREAPLKLESLTACPPPERLEAMLDVFRVGDREACWRRGPLYRFPMESLDRAVLVPEGSNLTVMRSGETGSIDDLSSLLDPQDVSVDWNWPVAVSRVDGQTVSACFGEPSACDAGVQARVYTRSGHRRRGLARGCAIAWARAVGEMGGLPLASAEWENRAACGLARELGLEIYADSLVFMS